MSLPRKARRSKQSQPEGVTAPSALDAPAPVETETRVLVRTNCTLAGVKRKQGEWILVPSEAVPGWEAGGLVASQATIDRLWDAAGRVLSPSVVPSQHKAMPYDPSALKVLQVTAYDPGSSVYRYHSAANAVPGVVSAFVRYGHSNPHCDLRQWDVDTDAATVELLYLTADVVHSHMDYYVLRNILRQGTRPGLMQSLTYHGSVDPANPAGSIRVNEAGNDDRMDAVVFGARPYHHRFKVKHWLPIPMPVADYQAVRKDEAPGPRKGRKFRVAHSPTRRSIKGTAEFLRACEYLTMHQGIEVEPVLIEGLEHGAALRLKASCDAVFDSFWLGMQGSGLEGGAMGMPVLAGDPEAQADLLKLGIEVPWTIANDEQGIRDQLARLATDARFYQQEAERVHAYVVAHHDYAVVGAKYATILTEAKRNGPPYRQ